MSVPWASSWRCAAVVRSPRAVNDSLSHMDLHSKPALQERIGTCRTMLCLERLEAEKVCVQATPNQVNLYSVLRIDQQERS